MANNLDDARNLFVMEERAFTIMGVWPLGRAYANFAIWSVYQVFHVIDAMADLFNILGDVELMIVSLADNLWNFVVLSKMLVLRFSRKMEKLTRLVISDLDEKAFENPEEWGIYSAYNRVAKMFFKLWVLMGLMTSVAMPLKSIDIFLGYGSKKENISVDDLPYRTCFFDVYDRKTFRIVWIYQLPNIYVNTFQTATIRYLFSLVLHACELMSILTFRIKKINVKDSIESPEVIFRDIVNRHQHIVRIINDINSVFSMVLLEELIICTLMVGMAAYSVIAHLETFDEAVIFASALEVATILLLIYGYCVAGQYLITESTLLYESYYLCQWYNMPDSVKKQLMICMIGSCKPIQLLAGGYYIFFSMENFTGVVKTAAGYISMLRITVN